MLKAADDLYQEVISDNKVIFERLQAHLQQARSEILVASAWFTDDILFNLLLDKAKSGVPVHLIIADNEENQKLDFDTLKSAGGSVLRIKNVGYGMMHQKFCVIDRQLALHGSYNWSVNAKKNNHESIIITNHVDTVESLVKIFNDLKERAVRILNGQSPTVPSLDAIRNNGIDAEKADANRLKTSTNEPIDPTEEFRQVLDAMLAAETTGFDREALRREGYDRAKSTNGDANVLENVLDSIYSMFVNAINLAEEKKLRILTKIEQLKLKAQETCGQQTTLKIETITAAINTRRDVLKAKIENLRSANEALVKSIHDIETVRIPECERKIEECLGEIKENEREFVKPAIRWFEMGPVMVFSTVLFVYLFLFYSSAAYILLFSEADAKGARMKGIEIAPPEVFHPDALPMALDRGWTSFFLVIFFAIVPIGFACSQLFTSKKWAQLLFLLAGLTVVDAFIAAKVAKAIHQIDYLTGRIDEPFTMNSLIYNVDFYLVFILGAFGLLLFKFVFGKLMMLFEERNPSIQYQKAKIRTRQLKAEIETLRSRMAEHQRDRDGLNSDTVANQRLIEANNQSLLELAAEEAGIVEQTKLALSEKLVSLERTAGIYISHVENNNIPIHVDAMKDRINVYLEGWNDLLHSEYSITRAVEKSAQAKNVVDNWQKRSLVKERIDHRIWVNDASV